MNVLGGRYSALAVTLALWIIPIALAGRLNANEVFDSADEQQSVELPLVVQKAARIARVRIIERSPVDVLGIVVKPSEATAFPDEICGYYLKAKVIESLKGDDSTFSFFSAVDEDFMGFDRDYLVFAFQRDPEEVRETVKAMSGLMRAGELTKLSCRAFGSLFVPVQPQLLRAFLPYDASVKGGPWIVNATRDSITWCVSLHGEPDRRAVEMAKVSIGKRPEWVVSWRSIRQLVLSAIARQDSSGGRLVTDSC